MTWRSQKDFVKKFSFAWILQVVKVRCFQFYLIKCPFFKCQTLKPCKIRVSWNFWTKTLFRAFPIILCRNLSKNHDFSNLNTFFRVLKNQWFIAKISKRAYTFFWECMCIKENIHSCYLPGNADRYIIWDMDICVF